MGDKAMHIVNSPIDGKWYIGDEQGREIDGPFDTEEDAKTALAYIRNEQSQIFADNFDELYG